MIDSPINADQQKHTANPIGIYYRTKLSSQALKKYGNSFNNVDPDPSWMILIH